MSESANSIREIDVAAIIAAQGGGSDILIDLHLGNDTSIAQNERVVIRNGVIIILCKADSGTIKVDGKEYNLSHNNIIVLPENHIIEYVAPIFTQDSNMIAVSVDYILNMPSPIDTSILNYSRYISVLRVGDAKFEDLHSYYKFIYKELQEGCRYQSEIIHSIFYALILEIMAEYENVLCAEESAGESAGIKDNNLSDRFFRLLATHYKQYRTVQFYAERLNLTPKYLSTAIKRATGRPMLSWINEAVMIDAKMLLRTTDLTVQQLSEMLNFSSPSAFVQFFRKHTATTPHLYRKRFNK